MTRARGRPDGVRNDPSGPVESDYTPKDSERLTDEEARAEARARLAVKPRRIVRVPGLPPGLAIGILPETTPMRAARVRDREQARDALVGPSELSSIRMTLWRAPGAHDGPPAHLANVGARVTTLLRHLARFLAPTVEVEGPIDPHVKPTHLLGYVSFGLFVGRQDDAALGGDAERSNATCALLRPRRGGREQPAHRRA